MQLENEIALEKHPMHHRDRAQEIFHKYHHMQFLLLVCTSELNEVPERAITSNYDAYVSEAALAAAPRKDRICPLRGTLLRRSVVNLKKNGVKPRFQ